jgi:DNA-binding MarR family transcriptional regulator
MVASTKAYFFSKEEQKRLLTVASGEFAIKGMTNKLLRHALSKTSGQVSRLLQRLRCHGLIKKAFVAHQYYLTPMGRRIITVALKSINMIMIPELSMA